MNIKKAVIFLLSISLCVILMAACDSSPGSTSSDQGNANNGSNQENGNNIEEGSEDVIQLAWQNSPHADTYLLDSAGNNNDCARCHGPENWKPPLEDIPASCFTCKFEVPDPPTFIPESDWLDISCYVCHEGDDKGNMNPEYIYLEFAVFGEYVEVDSTTELCQKCHQELAFQKHNGLQVGGVHAEYDCTDCHDPHDTVASCGSAGCHDEVSSPAGHDDDHRNVTCEACHDGSGLDLGYQDDGIFTTFIANEMDDDTPVVPFTSHNILLESNCDRCHYSGNPWSLSEDIDQP